MYRYTVETITSGQPRAYADSYRHVRVTSECFFAWLGDPKDPRSHWKPMTGWTEEQMRALLPHLKCGFTENTEWKLGSAKLDWLKQTTPGVWEFHTSEPYND
jgi:hypothetical protein